jgi:hypothetical protein
MRLPWPRTVSSDNGSITNECVGSGLASGWAGVWVMGAMVSGAP